jgi:EAL and modified HD-GYP domain-containing signal transduction protein
MDALRAAPAGAASASPAVARPSIMERVSSLEVVQLGRQAIYDASLSSLAYELFYRAASERDGLAADADRGTCSVVLSAFSELGLERVAGKKRIFLNVAHDVVSGALPLPVSPELVVLQVRDYEHSAAELGAALRARRAEGFQVALDGYVLSPETEPLLAVADYLKLDMRKLGPSGLREQLDRLQGRGHQTIACKIDSSEHFNACVAAGCNFFQGRFLFRPQVLSHKRLPKSLKTVTALLKRLRDPAVELVEIERIVKTDPALSVAVLGFFGSAAHALPQPVTSILQAVNLMGLRELSKWIMLVALTSSSERPSELVLIALIRARASESLARAIGADQDAAFTVGLTSMLEVLFERPLRELLESLPLTPEIKAAVLERTGVLGDILVDVITREQEEEVTVTGTRARSVRLDAGAVNRAWLEALSWAGETQSALR